MSLGEGVKPRLSQTLTRGARPDSNSRPAVQISNFLPSHQASWGLNRQLLMLSTLHYLACSKSIQEHFFKHATHKAITDRNQYIRMNWHQIFYSWSLKVKTLSSRGKLRQEHIKTKAEVTPYIFYYVYSPLYYSYGEREQ